MIDFAGQWLLGRMLALGHGRHLYHRNYQREVLRQAYPIEDEIPLAERSTEEGFEHEVDSLMGWLVGNDDPDASQAVASFVAPLAAQGPCDILALARLEQEELEKRIQRSLQPQVGGPLYPPIHALVMYPLGRLRPSHAYRALQFFEMLLVVALGWGIRLLSQGKIWWPVGIAMVLFYPGFSTSLNLGQNSIVILSLLVWGWVFLSRGRPTCAGIIWGLMAFKPVWAAAFFLVPLVTGRWRFCLAMLATGAALAIATLPLVGWQSWLEWLQVGSAATAVYNKDENWVFLSRDLLGIPKRWLLDFQAPAQMRASPAATAIGWGLLLSTATATVVVARSRRDRNQVLAGPPAAFLLLGGWLCCFHFMYYDVLLTALPVVLLLSDPRRYLQPVVLSVSELRDGATDLHRYLGPALAGSYPLSTTVAQVGVRQVVVRNSMTLTLLALFLVTDYLFPFLSVAVSVSAPDLKNLAIPTPIKFSTSVLGTPWNTFCLIALWLWCGWLWWRTPLKERPLPESSLPCSQGAFCGASQQLV
jgi:hypothetical protein